MATAIVLLLLLSLLFGGMGLFLTGLKWLLLLALVMFLVGALGGYRTWYGTGPHHHDNI